MNRIFSRVWSRSKGQVVVASELASTRRTGGSEAGPRPRRVALATALLGGACLLPWAAFAADAVCTDPVTGAPVGSTTGTGDEVACGEGAQAIGHNSVAIGTQAVSTGISAVALGELARADGTFSLALGANSVAASVSSVAIGDSADALAINTVALGANTTASGTSAVAVGDLAEATAANTVALGANTSALDISAVAIGDLALAGGINATAIGANTDATEASSVAVGDLAQATALAATAVGANSVASAESAAAFGNGAEASAQDALAAGVNSSASGLASVALGAAATASVDGGVAIGPNASVVHAGSVALGANSLANGATLASPAWQPLDALGNPIAVAGTAPVGEVSIGGAGSERRLTNVAAGAEATDAVNLSQLQAVASTISNNRTRYYSVNSTGGGNEDNDGATGADAIAAGRDAEAEGEQAVALGYSAVATGAGSLAFGAGAQALAVDSVALGTGAVASHGNSLALGAGSATTVGARASYEGAYVGTSSSTGEVNVGGRQITGVAAGSADTDAVNVSQLQGGVEHAINIANEYTDIQIGEVNTRIDNLDNRVTTIEGDIVDIRGDIIDLDNRVTTVEGDVENLTITVNEFDNRVTNLENGGAGPFQITQDEPYTPPAPTGANAAAGGNGAVASGDNSTAVGNQSVASGDNSTALGQGATASHDNSVALGQGSATTVGAQTNYNAAYVGGSTSTGEVNVGGRTISGVAPGIAGTDAVNVNQLQAGVNHAINVANQYTDNRITQIQNDVWTMDRGYRGATASAMAMAGLPQAYLPGKSMLAVGFGGYQNEYGMAVGLSGITENGRYVYKVQASGNTTRDWGFSVGAGLQW